jgi:hypothetical protein
MAVITGGLTVLDPTAEPVAERAERVPRPASLEGKRVGFLDNSKQNSDKVLQYLDEMLRERYGIAASIHRRKPNASRVLPDELLEEMLRECDVVIPAVGD